MARKKNPIGPGIYLDMLMQPNRLALAAAETIWHRSVKMATGTMTPAENAAMWMEKPTAVANGMEKAALAVVAGKTPAQIMSAAFAPMTAKASANAKRLRK